MIELLVQTFMLGFMTLIVFATLLYFIDELGGPLTALLFIVTMVVGGVVGGIMMLIGSVL